jgi:serine/threonine protein kinase/Tfp pilus assembly protein PilF
MVLSLILNSSSGKILMSLKQGTKLGPYEILSILGIGGTGQVYRALDTRLGRNVALKVLTKKEGNEDSEERLKREARSIAALSHSNILSIYDFGTSGEITYAVMELLDGFTLRQRLLQGVIPLQECLNYAIQICKGLQAAHEKNILHRDLKPENIFIAAEGQIKILDFGLARMNSVERSSNQDSIDTVYQTEKGILRGTFRYMSPEQAQLKQIDSRSDLFSLGSVLYEISTGVNPFKGDNFTEIIVSIVKDNPSPPEVVNPSLPFEWGRILRRLMEKDPQLRYGSASELRMDLEALQRTSEISTSRVRSIAVLPFSDMSQSKDQDYFCEGMAEEIINALAKIPGLKVTARISSFQFKNQSIDIREIGRRLGVATILEGSVRKAGERLRITSQLINVADGYHLWSDRFDRELRDVFEIQEEIAQAIVSALAVNLNPDQESALKKRRANPEAYEFYLRGRTLMNRESRKNLEYAAGMFEKAIEIDPDYAPAYAGLSDAFCEIYTFWGENKENLEKADKAIQKALELAPDIMETHLSRGHVLSLLKQYDQATLEFEFALKKDPRSFEVHYYYARLLWALGKMEEAASHFEIAAQIRPEDFRVRGLLVSIFRELKKTELVKLWAQRTLDVVQPWVQYHPDDSRALYFLAGSYAEVGEKDKALEWAKKSLAVDPEDPAIYYNLACMYATLKEIDNSLDMLEKAIDKGFTSRSWIENDGDLVTLRKHPRFTAILNKLSDLTSEGKK